MKTILTLSLTILLGLFSVSQVDKLTSTSSDDLLKLRTLQYEQAKRVIRMQDLKSEFDKLNLEQQSFAVEINEWIKDQAKKQNVDLTKNKFDLDLGKFVENKNGN